VPELNAEETAPVRLDDTCVVAVPPVAVAVALAPDVAESLVFVVSELALAVPAAVAVESELAVLVMPLVVLVVVCVVSP
jgi:hypothetical protein